MKDKNFNYLEKKRQKDQSQYIFTKDPNFMCTQNPEKLMKFRINPWWICWESPRYPYLLRLYYKFENCLKKIHHLMLKMILLDRKLSCFNIALCFYFEMTETFRDILLIYFIWSEMDEKLDELKWLKDSTYCEVINFRSRQCMKVLF